MVTFRDCVHRVQTAWFSPQCPLCQVPIGLDDGLCDGCRADLPDISAQCRYCALPLAAEASTRTCPDCLRNPRFDGALAAFSYHQPIARLIADLKYRGHRAHARTLGDLLAECIAGASNAHRPDIVAPVPLHPAAFRRRGFNQAERIATRLHHRLGWSIDTRAFQRTRDTARQSTLEASARAANVRNAFLATRRLDGLHIALLDDVMTTTRTAAALADCARRAGAARVDVYCVARA